MNPLRYCGLPALFADPQRRFHGADMIGRGAAASADQWDASRHEFSRVARHVLRRTEIDIPAFDRARHTGVWLRCQGQGSRGSYSLDGIQHGHRANAAVDAEDVDVPFGQSRREGFGVCAIEAVAIFVNRDLGDDWNLRIYVAAGEDGLMQLFEVAEGFEHQ